MKRLCDEFGIISLHGFSDRIKALDESIKKENGDADDVTYIIKTKAVRFANGEGKVVLEESVRNKTVFIFSDVSNHDCTYQLNGYINHMSPDDHFQDIKRTISAIAGSARRIIVVMPLLYSSRQHRRLGRESLDCALALQELERLEVDSVMTFDAHDINIQNAVSLMAFDSFFPGYPILKDFIRKEEGKIDKDNLIVVSPDTGAMPRAIQYASMLGLDVGMFYKRRDYTTIFEGKNPVVQHIYLGAEVKGKNILIIDDMLASGESIIDVAKKATSLGAKGAYVITTFAFFIGGMEKFRELSKNKIIKKIYSTNLSHLPDMKSEKWFVQVDLIPFVAKIVHALMIGVPISPMIDSSEKIKKLLDARKN